MAFPQPRRLIGVSTKMYFSAARTTSYVHDLLQHIAGDPSILSTLDVFIIPDFITLTNVVSTIRQASSFSSSSSSLSTHTWPILVGAQDASWADAGAYTGEVSPAVLAEVGASLVELGHAERRRLFHESDADTARKAAAVVAHGLLPLVCVGEQLVPTGAAGQQAAIAEAVAQVCPQVDTVLAALPDDAPVVLAYEPVWAIGAAEPANAAHVVGVAKGIKALPSVESRKGEVRIVYGGSAGPGLFEKLKDGVDGLFLGRFAHDPAQFWKTIQEVAHA